ncbi:MAG: IS4 family transposase [Candidatus Liptonbacteria bacterium]|nr:IS4 family transposase [Candidatus Liptonbacteria bacterium]
MPKTQFDQFVGQHEGDKWVKKMDTWNELVILLYSQASGKDSLREIEVGLDINTAKWYHLGIQSAARSTISYALNNRDYQIYEKLFYALLEKTKAITPTNRFNFENPLYSIDSTTVQLCLSIFDWAHFRTAKGAFKIHTLLNNRTAIPEFLTVTDGKSADISVIKSNSLALEKGSIAVFDRGYLDFSWWDSLNSKGLFLLADPKPTSISSFLDSIKVLLERVFWPMIWFCLVRIHRLLNIPANYAEFVSLIRKPKKNMFFLPTILHCRLSRSPPFTKVAGKLKPSSSGSSKISKLNLS